MQWPMDWNSKVYVVPGLVTSSAVALFLWEFAQSYGISDMALYGVGFGCLFAFAAIGWLVAMVLHTVRMMYFMPQCIVPRGVDCFIFYPPSGACGLAVSWFAFASLVSWHAAVPATLYITIVFFLAVTSIMVYVLQVAIREFRRLTGI